MRDPLLHETRKKWRAFRRYIAMLHYGARCVCCGETLSIALTFDHVEGGGCKERKLATRAITEGYPARFQVLCMNCNHAKADNGKCPHQVIRELEHKIFLSHLN